MTFFQEPPELDNQFTSDLLLQEYLKSVIPEKYYSVINFDLTKLGERTITDILAMGEEAQENEPELLNYDVWGKRVDEIKVSQGWVGLQETAAREGLVSIGYEREFGEYSRIYQMAKVFLYTPSSAIYTCPLAMTDGAARVIELLAKDRLENVYKKLISKNPDQFWVAGQWMTERTGGSDLADSSTIATPIKDDRYLLHGDKWFASAITCDIAMTLARIKHEDGTIIEGSRGLSLFYLPTRKSDGSYNGIRINRLKDKLGTRALPTAELTLDEAEAIKIGEEGKGVKLISTILNITRIYNAVSSIAYFRRAIVLAQNYSFKRKAFGKELVELPLHMETLAELQVEYVGCFVLVWYVVELMGKVETKQASDHEELVLRLLTPIVKLYTAKLAISGISEIVECFGGAGYLEETGIPALLRDAQVFSIWEGTTNVLSLDVLRVFNKTEALESWKHEMNRILGQYQPNDKNIINNRINKIIIYASTTKERSQFEAEARKLSFNLAEITISALLYRTRGLIKQNQILHLLDVTIERWLTRKMRDLSIASEDWQKDSKLLLY